MARRKLDDVPELALYTLDQVAELIPGASDRPKVTRDALHALALESGICRVFGGSVLFTVGDIRRLWDHMAAKADRHRLVSYEDAAADVPGHVIALGTRVDPKADIMVTWCHHGRVQETIDILRCHQTSRVELIEYAPMTAGAFRDLRRLMAPGATWRGGFWYRRTDTINDIIKHVFSRPEEEEGAE